LAGGLEGRPGGVLDGSGGRPHAPFGHRQLGLIDAGRGKPERAVQRGRDGRHPAHPAGEEDGRQVRLAGHPSHLLAGGNGPGQHRLGQLLELLASERRLGVEQRHVDERARVLGQHLLGLADAVPQLAAGPPVGGVDGRDEPLPQRRVARREDGAEVVDDGRVDVQPAAVGEAVGGEDLERVAGSPYDRRVERAGAEVVHEDRPALGDVAPGNVDVVRGRGHRLGHQADVGQRGGRLQQRLPALRAPRGRVGDDRLDRRLPGDPGSLSRHPVQDGGDQLGDRRLGRAQEDRALVDAPLRMRLVGGGVDGRGVLSVAADQQPAGRFGMDRRGQERGAIEQKGARLTPG
jgi:hypothetical protein